MSHPGQQSGHLVADRVRLPISFDPARLRADLDRIAGTGWIAHFVRQNYDGDWSVLPLRHVAGATHPVMMIYAPPGATEFVDGPLLADAPYLRDVLAQFRCPLQVVRLMRLAPGSVIKEHRDHDMEVEAGVVRLHIPIKTNEHVEFLLNGLRVDMAPGEAWYLRLSELHSVRNLGDEERVHLVIDCVADEWLLGMLRAGDNRCILNE